MKYLLLLLAVAGVVAAERPAVLFVGTKPEQVRTWDDWLAAGFEVEARQYDGAGTLEELRPFNVVVVQFVPGVQASPTSAA